ncbi:anaerobic dimethyl sulfoxide reductase subunit A [Enterobacter cancerogenus]|uniref:Anaerobic dimethyl sulfoxide reductase subunit A n=1 Tax=Enterobacter cancerogenus TaxID=69218 RepID=A0A484Z7G8_9ENTR|nr:anaerobic dimethyl sulfoxide reductase subunit A [Enterobacter cancerogenus]
MNSILKMPVMRACVRGRSYRKFVYHPDRLKYPMKRVGKRGEGKFERISWDEATTLIANNLKTITEKYGVASRYVHVGTAVSGGTFSGDKMVRRLLNLTGGYLESYHSVSMGNTAAAHPLHLWHRGQRQLARHASGYQTGDPVGT